MTQESRLTLATTNRTMAVNAEHTARATTPPLVGGVGGCLLWWLALLPPLAPASLETWWGVPVDGYQPQTPASADTIAYQQREGRPEVASVSEMKGSICCALYSSSQAVSPVGGATAGCFT